MLSLSKAIRIMRKDREKGFTLIELMIVVAILGILAAIAIPNFMRFQAKSKQSEAKTNLGAIGTTAEAFRSENDTYIATPVQLGWGPQGSTRYGYFYNATGVDPDGAGVGVAAGVPTLAGNCAAAQAGTVPGVAVASAQTTFVAAAQGDVDTDATCDVWTYNQTRCLDNGASACSGGANDVGT